MSFFITAFNFFFGSLYDSLRPYLINTVLLKYSFIIPTTFILFTLLFVYLLKLKKKLNPIGFYLNILLLLLILIDFVIFVPKLINQKKQYSTEMSQDFIPCDSCSKPDIYLIIADEYGGKKQLEDLFRFDNTDFENQLKNRKFSVIADSKSNYNTTVYSMASLFSMNYIQHLEKKIVNHRDMFICRNLINQNNLTAFLHKMGYKSFNFSQFYFDAKKNLVTSNFFISKKNLFVAQTFINRAWSEVGYHFINKNNFKLEKDRPDFNITKIYEETRRIVKEEKNSPKFVYTHLGQPHFPYYFDSSGRRKTYDEKTNSYPEEKKDYIEYLVYTNKKLLSLIDYILSNSPAPPIIILMSDHGYRPINEVVEEKYYFMNLNAVYIPNGNYSGFYNGMSNVNQFRTILNSQFGQKLPFCKDTTHFIFE